MVVDDALFSNGLGKDDATAVDLVGDEKSGNGRIVLLGNLDELGVGK